MTAGAISGLDGAFFDSMGMPENSEMPLSAADIQLPLQWDEAPLGLPHHMGAMGGMGGLAHDPWGSNGSGGSSRLGTWGVGGLGQMGATAGTGLDQITVPAGFSSLAPRTSGPSVLGGVMLGAPGTRTVGSYGGGGVGALNGGKSQQELQTELEMQEELRCVR